MWRNKYLFLALLIASCLTGCRGQAQSFSARNLTIELNVSSVPRMTTPGNQAALALIFDSDPASNETVRCNQTSLTQDTENTGRYYFRGFVAPLNDQFACTYQGQSQTVQFTFVAPQPFRLVAPSEGDTLSLQSPLALQITGRPSGATLMVQAGPQKTAPTVVPVTQAIVNLPSTATADGVMIQSTGLQANLRTGSGVIEIFEDYRLPVNGTVFRSVTVHYTVATGVDVTWQ